MGSVLRLPVIIPDRLEGVRDRLVDAATVELIAAVADPAAESFEGVGRPLVLRERRPAPAA